MTFEAPNFSGWQNRFSASVLVQGRRLFVQGAVSEVASDELGFVFGDVEEGRTVHEVELELIDYGDEAPELGVYCTCGGKSCRHAAAVLFAMGEPDAAAGLDAPEPDGSREKALSRETREWLDRFGTVLTQSNGPAPTQKPVMDKLVYALSVGKANGVQVFPKKVRFRNNGTLTRESSYELINCLNQPPARFVQPEDVRIALLITRGERYGSYSCMGETPLTGSEAVEILQLLLRTGRCYWKEIEGAPLAEGESRNGTLEWARDEKGFLRPIINVSGLSGEALRLNPFWYVDPLARVAGPLTLDVPVEAAQVWLEAPVISPRDTPVFAEAIQKKVQSPAVPVPESIEIVRPEVGPPQPCLKLATVRMQWWEFPGSYHQAGMEGIPVHCGRLTFDYQGVRIPPSAEGVVSERYDGKRLVILERDLKGEREAVALLEQLGFVRDTRFFGRSPPALSGSWVLDPNQNDAWHKLGLVLLPKLRKAGWKIELDPSFKCDVLEVTDWYAEAREEGGADWFDLELGVQVGKEKINLLPILLQALQTQGEELKSEKLNRMKPEKLVPIRLLDGRILPFPAGRLRSILSVLVELFDPAALGKKGELKLPKLRLAEVTGIDENDRWRWFGGETARELAAKLKNFSGVHPIAPPAGLQAQLRGYQAEGLNWLQFLREYELGGILADDMGLGKTIQALAHLLVEKEAGRLQAPALIVAPTSLMVNWRQEIEKFAPSLRVIVLHGPDRKSRFAELAQCDVALTTYPLLPRDAEQLLPLKFHSVILDEAQFIKNPKTQWAQIVCQFQAGYRLCLTGTPMENHLGELWSLFNFLLPGFLGDEVRFRALFRNPIEKGNNQERRQILARRVSPFLLRRRKEEVVKELPPKTEIPQNVELGGAQRDLYESIRLAMHRRVQEEVNKKGMSRSHIVILDALLKLRQVCCDPRLLSLEAAKKVEESAKLELLMDLVPEMLNEGRRILLFSQFTSMLELIEQRLSAQNLSWVKLTGSTTDRATPIQRFQNGEVPLFLISLKAGGTGLNLTAADTVIHYDPWWNPAVENQATDRAHRIGQEKPVFVYKLLTIGTVEEKIVALQSRKRALVEGLLNEGTSQRLDLSSEDLDFLFAPLG